LQQFKALMQRWKTLSRWNDAAALRPSFGAFLPTRVNVMVLGGAGGDVGELIICDKPLSLLSRA
jgi:hypothetical protein